MRIDAHQHFWKYKADRDLWITDEMSVIRRDFLPEDLQPILKQYNIDGCVAVQADQSEEETKFLLDLSAQHEFIKGVVGWIDLRSSGIILESKLQGYKAFPKLKGFRHVVQGEPKGFLADKNFIEGVRKLAQYGFTYDLLVYHHQLEEALKFVYAVPGVKIVIDHIAKPSIRTKEKTRWELNMAAIATASNVHCKLSGMVTEAAWMQWTKEDFEPFLDEMLEIFGPKRLMYGSDWPVCLLSGSYAEQLDIVESYIQRLSHTEREQIMGTNALNFYNL
jgi:L-fuconolactonase